MQAEQLEEKLRYIVEDLPDRTYHVMGSNAGAGSGEFHTYRAVSLLSLRALSPHGGEASATAGFPLQGPEQVLWGQGVGSCRKAGWRGARCTPGPLSRCWWLQARRREQDRLERMEKEYKESEERKTFEASPPKL